MLMAASEILVVILVRILIQYKDCSSVLDSGNRMTHKLFFSLAYSQTESLAYFGCIYVYLCYCLGSFFDLACFTT